MKTLADILSEGSNEPKRKILKLKNKVVINPDFSTYQARTHKDADTAVPLDTVKKDGTGAVMSTATGGK
jgi:hypothetical protein